MVAEWYSRSLCSLKNKVGSSFWKDIFWAMKLHFGNVLFISYVLGFELQEMNDSSISQQFCLEQSRCEGMTNFGSLLSSHVNCTICLLFLQVIKNNLNPVWRPFKISLNSLCYSDMDKSIKVVYKRCVYEIMYLKKYIKEMYYSSYSFFLFQIEWELVEFLLLFVWK